VLQPIIRRTALVALGLAAALAATGAAQAKGPSRATVNGPGLAAPLVVRGSGEDGGSSSLGRLAEDAGFFPAVFGQSPDPMLPARPAGALGPRYTITYTVPGPGRSTQITQDLYPYAGNGAITYMRPGQKVFSWQHTRGGWYAAYGLRAMLVRAGLPARPPVSAKPGPFSGRTWLFGLGGAVVLAVLAAAAAVAWRRPRPAPTT
jgi:hypothetical protein